MTPPNVLYPDRPNRFLLWLVILLGGASALGVLFVVAIVNSFGLSPEARALRSAVAPVDAAWQRKIEIGVGELPLHLVRAGLGFFKLDPEVRAGLRSIRSASVGVYSLAAGPARTGGAGLLATADAAMARRGWDRVVGVLDGDELVAIYMPTDGGSLRRVKVCVVVVNHEEMVVVSARADVEPLLKLALDQPQWREHVDRIAASVPTLLADAPPRLGFTPAGHIARSGGPVGAE